MPLILAVDRDRRQATQLVSLVRKRLDAELVHATTAAEALEALGGRVPDLILTSSLLSPKDDGLLAGHLRTLGQKAAHVQTLTIPLLRSSKPGRSSKSSVMSKLRRDKVKAPNTDGCDPQVFADEIGLYLARAAEERQTRVSRDSTSSAAVDLSEPPPESSELVNALVGSADPVEFAEQVEFAEPEEFAKPVTFTEPVTFAGPLTIAELATPAADDVPVARAEEEAIVDDAVLAAAPLETASIESPEAAVQTLEAIIEEYPTSPEFNDPIIEAAPDVDVLAALADSFAVPADAPPEYASEPTESVDKTAELAARDAIASAFQELRDADGEGLIAYPTSLEEALAAVNATLTALENAPHDVVSGVSAAAANANHGTSSSQSTESDPLVSVPLDRLVALFADMQHDEGRAIAGDPNGGANAAAPPDVAAAPPPTLDDESLALIGEAARKTSLDASAPREAVSTKSAPQSRNGRSAAHKSVEIDLSSEIEAIEPERPGKEAEAADAAPADASDAKDKDARGKKKPRRKSKGPIQDEWGLFDPDQCGFSALVDKLDEVTDSTEEQKPQPQGTRVRLISSY